MVKEMHPTSNAWTMSLEQGAEVTDALVHYSAGELDGKLERITGHGSTKPNDIVTQSTRKKSTS